MKGFLVSLISLWIGAILQLALPDRMAIFGARPDFLLTFSLCLGLYLSGYGAVMTGFFAGAIQASLFGAFLGPLVFSRMAANYLMARIESLDIEIGPLLGTLVVGLGSLICSIFYLFVVPPPAIGPYLTTSVSSALYNCIIALPILAVLRRLFSVKSSGV